MPQINLLSSGYSKKKRIKSFEPTRIDIAKSISFFLPVSYIVIIILVCIWLILSFISFKDRNELKALEKRLVAASADPKEISEISLKKDSLRRKMELLENLSTRKFFWWDKLSQIAEFMPDGVWLTEISLEKSTPSVSDKKKEKEIIMDEYVLIIKGSAFAYKIQDAVNLIGKFNNSLKQDEKFAKYFSDIILSNVAKSSVGKTDIMNFEFQLILR
ncbi:MAG: hypothetical protein Q8O13_08870 [Candidatus Omnitrophota bacterium]|nr:hypothetical protein [Candidatus Omnitrophota bacterium]